MLLLLLFVVILLEHTGDVLERSRELERKREREREGPTLERKKSAHTNKKETER